MGNPMLKSLDPFRFLLIAVAGWMNQRQLPVIDRHSWSSPIPEAHRATA
jgi:hypothetical protein